MEGDAMASLVEGILDPRIVDVLKHRAAQRDRSAEVKHRALLQALHSMPKVGRNEDLQRL